MIGYLQGTIHFKYPDSLILLTNGVGYTVYIPPTINSAVTTGQSIELFIHTQVREEILDLYGFRTTAELAFFKLLLNVSGIGAKTALLVVDRGVEAVHKAILNADVDFFTTIPRLGRKNAQKIIIELKNKLGSLTDLDLQSEDSSTTEVLDALIAMGYSRQEAVKATKQIPEGTTAVEAKIRFALRALGQR